MGDLIELFKKTLGRFSHLLRRKSDSTVLAEQLIESLRGSDGWYLSLGDPSLEEKSK